MFIRQEIFARFASCYPYEKLVDLAAAMETTPQVVDHWKTGRTPIPWGKLKNLVDDKGIRWDWLIEGSGPKLRKRREGEVAQPLDRHGINERFLSLFPGMSQAKIAAELGINQTAAFKWRHDVEQGPWERLKYAVDNKGVTWEWLLEGR